jgi:hypothetical protein
VNVAGEVKVGAKLNAKTQIKFDQEDRHRLFWKHIRDKDYISAGSFIDRRVCYFNTHCCNYVSDDVMIGILRR